MAVNLGHNNKYILNALDRVGSSGFSYVPHHMSTYEREKLSENILKEDFTNIVIQINGKKRGLIKTKINTSENELLELIKEDEKLSKYIFEENIKRKIYIKNKLINIIL